MKKILLFIFCICFMLGAVDNPFLHTLPFKEAIIEYNLSGSQKGIKTLYIKNYGMQRVIYLKQEKTFMNKEKFIEKYILKTKKWIYEISPHKSIAIRTPNLDFLLYIRYKELSKKEQEKVKANLKAINYLPILDSDFKIIKKYTKVNDISCDLLLQHGQEICYGYKGALELKSNISLLGFKKYEILYSIYKTKVDPNLFDISCYSIKDDKIKSVQKYEQSKKIIDFLKKDINLKSIFIKKREDKEDFNQIIQEGIKNLMEVTLLKNE